MGRSEIQFELPEPQDDDIEVEVDEIEVEVEDEDLTVDVEKDKNFDENDDDVEIEVYNDVPKADRNRKPSEPPEDVTDEELANYSEKVQARIKKFNKGYHDERRAKEAASRERDEAMRFAQQLISENKRLKQSVEKNREVLLENAKKAAIAEHEAAKKAFQEAHEAGDTKLLLDAQESITSAKLKIDKLDNYKLPPLQDEYTTVQGEESTTHAQEIPVDEKASRWAQKNPWFNSDREMTAYALGLHEKLVHEEGLNPTSDRYYEKIDSRMRELFPERFDDIDRPKPRPRAKQSDVVAPATRSTGPKKVRISASAAKLAKRLGLSPKQYAEEVAAMQRNQKNG